MANGTFSYGINTPPYAANPPVDFPRLLISDTQQFAADGITPIYVFSDEEIVSMELIVMGIFQSGQFFNSINGPSGGGSLGSFLPSQPIPYYRVAGMLLSSLAANKARLASVVKLLDVTLAPDKAAKALQDQAKLYFDADDNSGAFVIIEQVNNDFAFRDRYWKTWLRQGVSA